MVHPIRLIANDEKSEEEGRTKYGDDQWNY